HAQQAFDRVRLEGPYSNRALLSTGWAEVSAHDYEKALVPWGMLIGRDATDAAVQEAKLALPFAYSRLQLYGRAALLYGQALDSFDKELEKVDASVRSIRAGNFLKALVREEIKQDNLWVVRLRTLPDTPETFYLTDLTAPRPALLATTDERLALERLRQIEKTLGHSRGGNGALCAEVQRLQGVLTWRLYTEYPERLTQAHEHLHELSQDVRMLQEQYTAFVRARQAAVHSYA